MNNVFLNLTNMILMWLLGVTCLAGLLIILAIVLFKQKDNKKNFVIEIIMTFICIAGLWLSLPFFTEPIAVFNFGTPVAEKTLKIGIKTAVIPEVKSALYYELSRNYQVRYKGKEAIESYEKALSITQKSYAIEQGLICPVYFWKGDRKKIQEVCYDDVIAADYLRAKEYDKAIETINKSIEKYERENRTNGICNAYAIRAAIYKQKGDNSLYKKDYDKVVKTCPEGKNYKTYMEADDIVDVYLGGKELNRYEF